jgi:NADH-quinone oxidoreductase subunit M
MGFVLLGMASHTAIGYTGAIYQLVSHGVISAFLFMAVGILQYQTGSRSITHFQGLAVAMPRYTALVGVGFFAALGLPLFSGFIAEVFVLMGSVEAATHKHMSWTWVVLALLSLVITAGYFLWAFKRMFLGKLWQQADLKPVHDITHGQVLLLAVPLGLALFLGIWPRPMLELIETFVLQLPGFGV